MKIIDSVSIKGIGKYNNDIMNYDNNFCYVMDGATSVFNDNLFFESSDLYEYMNLLKANIMNNSIIADNLIKGIEESNKNLKNINTYPEYELPTFTIAAVKEYDSHYELYLLCDCLISILYKNGEVENIEDHRFDNTKNACREEIKNITKLEEKRIIWRKYRKLANNKNGYPVGSTNSNSIKNGIIKKINKNEIDKILICSDGLYSEVGMPIDNTYFEPNLLHKKITKNNDDLTYIIIEND